MIPLPYVAAAILGAGLMAFLCRRPSQAILDKRLHENLTDKQIDKMIDDSFPASDPPSTY